MTDMSIQSFKFVCMPHEVNRLTAAEAEQTARFLDVLLSEVVCRQLLPAVFGPTAAAFGLELRFRADVRQGKRAAGAGLAVEYSSRQLVAEDNGRILLADMTCSHQMAECLKSADGYKRTFMSLSLLSSLFSGDWKPDICFVFRPPNSLGTRMNSCTIRLAVPYSLPNADSVESLLEWLLTDGRFDLGCLSEFMMG